jgi:hypothetical protein
MDDDLTTFRWRLSWNLEPSTCWNAHGLSRPLMGLLCPGRMYSQQRGVAPKCTSDVRQGYSNPGRQFATTTPFCTVVPNVGGSTTQNWLQVSLLATRTLKWLLEICTICARFTKPTIQQPCSWRHKYQNSAHLHQNTPRRLPTGDSSVHTRLRYHRQWPIKHHQNIAHSHVWQVTYSNINAPQFLPVNLLPT